MQPQPAYCTAAGYAARMSAVRRIAIRGMEMELEDAGSSERPFVLVHGFTGSRDDFREHVPELARLGRTIALDQRGHGGSTNSGRIEDYTLDGLVADLEAAFDALGLTRADLLGHSLGGMVALRFALAHPHRVASLVLMDTSPSPVKMRFSEQARAGVAALAREHGMSALAAAMRELASRSPDAPAAVKRTEERMGPEIFWERIRRKLEAMDPVAWDALSRALGDQVSVADRLGEIDCPTLVLVGAEDTPFLKPSAELERGIRGAARVTIPDAAHSPQLENPPAWSAAIHAHLSRAR
jgi:2-succinyl-6-hydroxy-2,4-cyclohexadiene-1-carboxylate synthase